MLRSSATRATSVSLLDTLAKSATKLCQGDNAYFFLREGDAA
jgi:hypothetical protein